MAEDYHGGQPPWMRRDVLHAVGAKYPADDQRRHHVGVGLFRITIDSGTGKVSDVSVLKSTGFRMLDWSCLNALRRWRWKPGTWREVDVPITFGDAEGPIRLSPGGTWLPNY